MRKILIYILVISAVVTLISGAVVAKFISSIDPETGTLSTPVFFFRSNVLKEGSVDEAVCHTVKGKSTDVVLTNGAGSDEYANVEISYKVSFSVRTNNGWVKAQEDEYYFQDSSYQKRTVTVEPITYNSVIYDTVMVEAVSSAPYQKTLCAIFIFEYDGYDSGVSYDNGVITLTVATNFDSGSFRFGWADGITPDNSDPNLILTGVTSSMRSITATLEEKTVYELKFFVTDAALLSALDGGEIAPADVITVSR